MIRTLHRNLFERTTTTDSGEGIRNLLKYQKENLGKSGAGHHIHFMFYCLQAPPLGIPNVLNICHLSPYLPSLFSSYFFAGYHYSFLYIKSLSLQTYLTDLPYQGLKLNLQTYPTNLPTLQT